MLPAAELDPLPGRLAENVMHFARVLRNAGLPIGTDRVLLAFDGLRTAGIGSRADLHAILAACFLSRGEHRTLFEQAFHIFWRDPDFLGRIMQMLMPQVKQRVSALDVAARTVASPPRCLAHRPRRGSRPKIASRSMRRSRGATASSCARWTSTR